MTGLIMAAQLIAGLSILVLIHELGHFLAARAFGIRVEKFYLFFDAWKFRLFKFKVGDTEYGIGWLPLGGYVKIAGMIDESMDKEAMKKPAQPWEFRSKPAWQRLIVMLAGVIMNVILGMILFTFVTYHYEKEYLPVSQLNNGVYAYETGRDIGFATGDKIIAINGHSVERFKDVSGTNVLLGATITIDRGGKTKDIVVPGDFYKTFTNSKKSNRDFFIEAHNFPCVVDSVFPGMNAYRAPLCPGDKILAVDSITTKTPAELSAQMKKSSGTTSMFTVLRDKDTINVFVAIGKDGFKDPGLQKGDDVFKIDTTNISSYGAFRENVWKNKGKKLNVQFSRGNDTLSTTILVDTAGYVGVYCKLPYINKTYTIGSAISYGVSDAMGNMIANVRGLGKIFSGKESASDSVQGPIGIAKIYGGIWDWHRFWLITGLLSMILAFMNILPIPALDGGHVIFTTIELITGKKFSDKFMEKAQIVGMVILLAIMAFAIGNDIWKSIF
jgi:regulator of sigma E protease